MSQTSQFLQPLHPNFMVFPLLHDCVNIIIETTGRQGQYCIIFSQLAKETLATTI